MEKYLHLIESVHCDMLNMRYEKVGSDEFGKILSALEKMACNNEIMDYDYHEEMGSSKYRHNITIYPSTYSEGGIYIGWQHNSEKAKESCHYDMKVEFNPSKVAIERTFEDGVLVETKKIVSDLKVYKMLGPILDMKICRIIEFDIAIDVKVPINELVSLSKKGRYMDLHKGTRYYGTKHKDMYLKVYDKTRERKEKAGQVVGGNLTRIEFTHRPCNGNGVTYHNLKKSLIDFDNFYTFALYNENDLTDNMISNILCILHGLRQFKDFHHKNKKKIIETIEDKMVVLSINKIVGRHWEQFIEPIREWSFSSGRDEYSGLEGFMELLKYNNNEEYEYYLNEHVRQKN